jgi:hypothetical protein
MASDAVEARLRALEDERAILETLYRHGHSIDYGPDADFVDCFVADGVWDVQMRRSASGLHCRGHAEIRASLATQASARAPALFVKHIVVAPLIVVTGDRAAVQRPGSWPRVVTATA